jgi:hypothetical protein
MSGDSIGDNSFERKILPVCDCAPRISSQFAAKPMIPIDQGGGGIPLKSALAQPKPLPMRSLSKVFFTGKSTNGRHARIRVRGRIWDRN